MEREYKKITTPISKQVVEIKEWLTGREKRQLTGVFFDNANLSEKNVEGFKIDSSIMSKAQDKAFETVVVSIDNNKNKIIDTLLDMRSEDFDFIVEEINKITNSELEKEVKKE